MTKLKQVTLRLEEEIYKICEEQSKGMLMAEFLRRVITDFCCKYKSDGFDLLDVIKKIKILDTKTIEQKVIDLELANQLIFEEIKKQNELLTIIHRRSTIGANIVPAILDDLKKSDETSITIQKECLALISTEIEKLQLTIRRK